MKVVFPMLFSNFHGCVASEEFANWTHVTAVMAKVSTTLFGFLVILSRIQRESEEM